MTGPYENLLREFVNVFNTINNVSINYGDAYCNNSKHDDEYDKNIIDVEYREVDIDDDREII